MVGIAIAVALLCFAIAVATFQLELSGSHREAAVIALDAAFGATVEPLDNATARSLDVDPGLEGLVVTSVATDGPAARAGLRAGDVIERIAGRPIGSLDEVAAALKAARSPIVLTLNRRGKHVIVRLTIRSDVHDPAERGDKG